MVDVEEAQRLMVGLQVTIGATRRSAPLLGRAPVAAGDPE
jgi:hypothetical protein